MPEILKNNGILSHLVSDHYHYWEEGGANYHTKYTNWEFSRGQEGDPYWLDANVPLEYSVEPRLIRYTAERWHQVLTNRAHRRVETDWFAPGTYKIAIEWLERNYQREDFFLWLDTFDPHEPWDPPQHYIDLYDPGYEGRVFDAPSYGLRASLGMTDAELNHTRARYAGEVTMVDACVGRLLATLERLGISDEVMIIFTSDHGTYFDYPGDNGLIQKAWAVDENGMLMRAGKRTQFQRYFPLLPGVYRIPLMIHTPGQSESRRLHQITQPWDLTATVLDAYGLPAPEGCLGSSLLPLSRGEEIMTRDVAIVGKEEDVAQAVSHRWLYATWRGRREPALFDLQRDPDIVENVIAEEPGIADWLQGKIVDFMRKQDLDDAVIESFVPYSAA